MAGITEVGYFDLEHLGHFTRPPFSFGGFVAGKKLVYSFIEDAQPGFKMFTFNRQLGMRRKRTAKVGVLFQQYGLPKAIHFFQMLRPSILNTLVENRAYYGVLLHLAIKGINQFFYIVQVKYIVTCCHQHKYKHSIIYSN